MIYFYHVIQVTQDEFFFSLPTRKIIEYQQMFCSGVGSISRKHKVVDSIVQEAGYSLRSVTKYKVIEL